MPGIGVGARGGSGTVGTRTPAAEDRRCCLAVADTSGCAAAMAAPRVQSTSPPKNPTLALSGANPNPNPPSPEPEPERISTTRAPSKQRPARRAAGVSGSKADHPWTRSQGVAQSCATADASCAMVGSLGKELWVSLWGRRWGKGKGGEGSGKRSKKRWEGRAEGRGRELHTAGGGNTRRQKAAAGSGRGLRHV